MKEGPARIRISGGTVKAIVPSVSLVGSVLAFSSVAEAAGCIEQVNADYEGHRRAARQIAAEVFDYRVVLPRLLDTALGDKTLAARSFPAGGTP